MKKLRHKGEVSIAQPCVDLEDNLGEGAQGGSKVKNTKWVKTSWETHPHRHTAEW